MKVKRGLIFAAIVVLLVSVLPCASKASAAAKKLKPKAVETEVTLTKGTKNYKIELINVIDGATVKYSSSDKKVVTVKKGKVTAKGAGTATVTVKVKQNKKTYKVKIKFTVEEKKSEPEIKTSPDGKDYDALAKTRTDKLIKDVTIEQNTTLKFDESRICRSEKDVEANIIYGCKNSSLFHLYFDSVDDLKLLRAEEEYLDLMPSIDKLKFLAPTKYSNVVSLTVTTTEQRDLYADEFALDCAFSLGDTSYLEPDEKKLYDKVIKLSKELKGKDEYTTVKNIHDYIVLNFAYPLSYSGMEVHTLSYALDQGICVCDGYSKSFYFLCKAAGIDCVIVKGVAYNPDGSSETHAWNKVNIDGKWYAVDPTWDDPVPDEKGRLKYYYFLVTDKDISSNHSWDDTGLPKADSRDLGTVYVEYGTYSSLNGDKEASAFLRDELDKAVKEGLPVKINFFESSESASFYEKAGEIVTEYCSKYYCGGSISYESIGFLGYFYTIELH